MLFDQAKAHQLVTALRRSSSATAAPVPSSTPPQPAPPLVDKGKQREREAVRSSEVEQALKKLLKVRAAVEEEARKAVESVSPPLEEAGPSQTAQEKRLAFLRLQFSNLQAEVARRRQSATVPPRRELGSATVPSLGEPPIVSEARARQAAVRQVQEHEKAARMDQELLEDAREELAMAKRMRDEAAIMKAGLLNRQAEVKTQAALTPEDLLKNAEEHATATEESLMRIQGQLVDFIDRLGEDGQAPASDVEEEARDQPRGIRLYFQPAKRNKKNDPPPETKAHLLKTLLEKLMNQSVTSPTDPWVDVLSPPADPTDQGSDVDMDPRSEGLGMPHALVNYIIRAGIAVEHRSDPRKVKLVEFWRSIRDE